MWSKNEGEENYITVHTSEYCVSRAYVRLESYFDYNHVEHETICAAQRFHYGNIKDRIYLPSCVLPCNGFYNYFCNGGVCCS